MATDYKLAIINSALTAAGEEPLTALEPGSVMGNAAISNYDAIVGEELENASWKFATKEGTPTLLTTLASHPLRYQWQIPSDAMEIDAVMFRGVVLEGDHFTIEGNVVRTRWKEHIKLRYRFRPDESMWPQRFQRIIAQRLEALFLRATERHTEAESRDEATGVKTVIARHTEARQRSNRPLGPGTVAAARMGRRPRRSS